MISLNKCNGLCNTLDDPSGRIFVLNKTENVNINLSDMMTRINELKTLAKPK